MLGAKAGYNTAMEKIAKLFNKILVVSARIMLADDPDEMIKLDIELDDYLLQIASELESDPDLLREWANRDIATV